MLLPRVSYPQDGVLTTLYIPYLWWEWHSSKDLEDWPKYSIQFSDRLSGSAPISGIIESHPGEWLLFAESEVLNQREIYLSYSEYIGDGPSVEEDLSYSTRVKMEIRHWEDSVYHEYALYVSDRGGAPDLVLLSDLAVRSNLRRTLKGLELITMGAVYGMTTQNVRIRTAPRITASVIRFLAQGTASALDYCPKETQIRVLARTVQKKRVQQWTDYWYRVENIAGQGMMQRYGWIFGEFIAFSPEDVSEAEAAPRPWEGGSDNLPASPQSDEIGPAMKGYD